MYGVKEPLAKRFWEKVDRHGPVPTHRLDLGPCWLWTAHVDAQTGYGRFQDCRKPWNAHQWAYTRFVGPIEVGHELDHLCRVRHCVNLGHLDPVPHKVNMLRGMHPWVVIARSGACNRGHPATPENVYTVKTTGHHQCRVCRRESRTAQRTV